MCLLGLMIYIYIKLVRMDKNFEMIWYFLLFLLFIVIIYCVLIGMLGRYSSCFIFFIIIVFMLGCLFIVNKKILFNDYR